MTRAKSNLTIFKEVNERSKKNSFQELLLNTDYDFIVENIKTEKLKKERNYPKLYSTNHKSTSNGKYDNEILPTSSITGYNTFIKCPRLYYYKYISKIIINDNNQDRSELLDHDKNIGYSSLEYGNYIHYSIENLNSNLSAYDQLKENIQKFNLDWDSVKTRALSNIDNYFNSIIDGNSYHELKYTYRLENGDLIGSIDNLTITDRDIFVIDYKTNLSDNYNRLISQYKDQMILYKLVSEKLLQSPVIPIINFLEYGKVFELDINQSDTKDLIERLDDFLYYIRYNSNKSEYNKTDHCNHNCIYYDICN